jgi:hypothetical protein
LQLGHAKVKAPAQLQLEVVLSFDRCTCSQNRVV